jgi:hypothetical protein
MRNAETCGHGQLVEACGVFSYSPATEGARLSAGGRIYANGGHVVFDCFTEAELSGELLERWRGAPDRYPIIIPRGTMIDFCKSLGLHAVSKFTTTYGVGQSRYFIIASKIAKSRNVAVGMVPLAAQIAPSGRHAENRGRCRQDNHVETARMPRRKLVAFIHLSHLRTSSPAAGSGFSRVAPHWFNPGVPPKQRK